MILKKLFALIIANYFNEGYFSNTFNSISRIIIKADCSSCTPPLPLVERVFDCLIKSIYMATSLPRAADLGILANGTDQTAALNMIFSNSAYAGVIIGFFPTSCSNDIRYAELPR